MTLIDQVKTYGEYITTNYLGEEIYKLKSLIIKVTRDGQVKGWVE
jgi:hypothetical protein